MQTVSNIPLNFLWLEITAHCNLTCSHCYASSGPANPLNGRMTISDWYRVLEEARELNCSNVQFIGGEVSIHPYLAPLIKKAADLDYKMIEVFTNGTEVTKSLVSLFKHHRVRTALSFYSENPKVHEAITGKVGSFGRTVKGISTLVTEGIEIRVGIIEMQQNSGGVHEARAYLERLGVTNIGEDRIRSVGRGEEYPNVEPTRQLCGQCWKGKLCVTPSGDCYPCVFSRDTCVGSALSQSITSVVVSDELLVFQAAMANSQGIDVESVESTPHIYNNPDCFPNPSACNPTTCEPKGGGCNPVNSCWPHDDCYPKKGCNPDTTCWPKGGSCNPQKCYPI